MSETLLMHDIQRCATEIGARLMRNNSGAARTIDGRFIIFGVGGKGGADLLGIYPVTITSEMIGQRVGIFMAIEVKTPKGRVSVYQKRFINGVKKLGGISYVVRSVEEFKFWMREIVESWGGNWTLKDSTKDF